MEKYRWNERKVSDYNWTHLDTQARKLKKEKRPKISFYSYMDWKYVQAYFWKRFIRLILNQTELKKKKITNIVSEIFEISSWCRNEDKR
jgi:hypothetical protein